MIRIKDYIFNENDIRKIYYNKDCDTLCVGFRDKDLVTNWVENATFDDIEWNYGEDENNKLRENNRELVETNVKLAIENKKLREKINFAENILYDYLYKDGKITEELYLKYKGEE